MYKTFGVGVTAKGIDYKIAENIRLNDGVAAE